LPRSGAAEADGATKAARDLTARFGPKISRGLDLAKLGRSGLRPYKILPSTGRSKPRPYKFKNRTQNSESHPKFKNQTQNSRTKPKIQEPYSKLKNRTQNFKNILHNAQPKRPVM
jgi:hypothetical protein